LLMTGPFSRYYCNEATYLDTLTVLVLRLRQLPTAYIIGSCDAIAGDERVGDVQTGSSSS